MIDVGLSLNRVRVGDPVELGISLANTGTGLCTNVIFTIRLPAGIARLHGRERIEVRRLPPGQSVTSHLRIRAEKPGRYRLTSTNFSFRDHRGRPHRESGFAAEIIVDPAPDPLPEPRVKVDLHDAELPYDEWTIVRGQITNIGEVDVGDLEIMLSGQLTTDHRTAHSTLEQLPPGRSVDVPFYVLAQQAGANVPVHLDVAYNHHSGRRVVSATHSVRVAREHTIRSRATPGAARRAVKVLILGANPPDTEPLRIDSEIREIQETIRAGKDRDNIEVSVRLAVRPEDISQALLDDEPQLVHFTGHGGSPHKSFAAESEYGLAHVIPVEGLVGLFGFFGKSVECVVVNACDTELLARELSAVIPYVIGMRQPVRDRSAIRFSSGFYRGLAAGKSIEDAFQLGVIELKITPIGFDALAPVLFRRDSGR